jgi:hypothetical protein
MRTQEQRPNPESAPRLYEFGTLAVTRWIVKWNVPKQFPPFWNGVHPGGNFASGSITG